MPSTRQAPWKKSNPKGKKHTRLTEAQKQIAKTRAAKAGRRYPNLIDNMYAARQGR